VNLAHLKKLRVYLIKCDNFTSKKHSGLTYTGKLKTALNSCLLLNTANLVITQLMTKVTCGKKRNL